MTTTPVPPGGHHTGCLYPDPPSAPPPGSTRLEDYLAAMASAGPEMDLAFVVLAMQIQKHDSAIQQKMQSIRDLSALKDALSEKIEKLRQLKQVLSSAETNGDDDEELSLRELNTYLNGVDAHPNAAQHEKICKTFGLVDAQLYLDPRSGQVAAQGDKLIGSSLSCEQLLDEKVGGSYRINSKMVDEAIGQLNDKLQRLSSDNEIEMIKLNDLISKKGQVVQLLSNVMKKEQDTLLGVIANLK